MNDQNPFKVSGVKEGKKSRRRTVKKKKKEEERRRKKMDDTQSVTDSRVGRIVRRYNLVRLPSLNLMGL